MQTNCTARAKFVLNKRLNTLRLVVTFDLAAKHITVRNAAFVSGDICDAEADGDIVARAMLTEVNRAKQLLRTDNIVFVD